MTEQIYHFDLPYGARPPALLNPDLDIARVMSRPQEQTRVTVLDTPDHRLLRTGVLLAHRVRAERVEWYLSAPQWSPLLPAEQIVTVDAHEDLPAELADKVRPFRRRGVLAPVATLEILASEYELRDPASQTIAFLHDERTTVRRGGLTTARYREVTLRATDRATDAQVAWVRDAIELVGGAAMIGFPPLTVRLGAPATGLSDLPTVRVVDKRDLLDGLVAARFGERLRALIAADLHLRNDHAESDLGPLRETLAKLARDLDGLSGVLEPQWRRELADQVDWLLQQAEDNVDALLGERYLAVLDALVPAARAPRLGTLGKRPAREVMGEELAACGATLLSRAQALTVDADDAAWEETLATVRRLGAIAAVGRDVMGSDAREARQVAKHLEVALAGCVEFPTDIDPALIGQLSPMDAFEAGRLYEHVTTEQRAARIAFLRTWRRQTKQLDVDLG